MMFQSPGMRRADAKRIRKAAATEADKAVAPNRDKLAKIETDVEKIKTDSKKPVL